MNTDKARKLLQMCYLQAKLAIDTSEGQVNLITAYLVRLSELEQRLRAKIEANEDSHSEMDELRQIIFSIMTEFQFFDLLKQRTISSINPLRDWAEKGVVLDLYQQDFIDSYATAEQREVYRVLMEKNSIVEAIIELNIQANNKNNTTKSDDIEDDDAIFF